MQFSSYNQIFKLWKQNLRYARQKKNSNSCVVRKKNSERNIKPYAPPTPFKLNDRSLNQLVMHSVRVKIHIVLKYYIFSSNFARIKTYDTVHFVNWFKTDIAEILLKVALKHPKSINPINFPWVCREVRIMVLNATFNNISVLLCCRVLLWWRKPEYPEK